MKGVEAKAIERETAAGQSGNRRIWLDRRGDASELRIRDGAVPTPGDGEVRIRVEAIGLNFAEVMIRLGVMPNAPQLPMVLGWEVAGVVEIGAGEFRPGDRVFAMTDYGGYSEVVVAPARHVFHLPDDWTFEMGAAFSVSYLVAYQALWVMGSARPGNTVLVHGAAGAIGQAATQLAQALGCTVLGCASPAKHDLLRERGVTPIDYKNTDFVVETRRLTKGRGVDLVLDAIGGENWQRSYDALAPTGRLLTYGMHEPVVSGRRSLVRMVKSWFRTPKYSPLVLLDHSKGVLGLNLGHLFSDPEFVVAREWIGALLEHARQGHLRPSAGMVLPFDDVAIAHARMQDGTTTGKVVLKVG